MSDKNLSSRQKLIILHCRVGKEYALSDIAELLRLRDPAPVSAPTLRRDMALLCKHQYFIKTGSRKLTRYTLKISSLALAPVEAHQYCQIDIDSRPGNSFYNYELFAALPPSFFNTAELARLHEGTGQYLESSKGASQTARRKELERFIIELSWKSSKIEGNTYSLLDTELLLREGVEATGHPREETMMVLNHKRAFDFILTHIGEFTTLRLSQMIDIHRLLVTDLNIDYGLRNRLIGITGSLYKPLSVPTQIEEACTQMFAALETLKDPFSKALLIIAGISYIQPFEDGNKRTSRLSANAFLLASRCAPLSYRSISEIAYREAMLTFYEKNSICSLKEIFLEQYLFACDNYMHFA